MKAAFIIFGLTSQDLLADPPAVLPYQGRVIMEDGSIPTEGSFRFMLYHGTRLGEVDRVLWNNDTAFPTYVGAPDVSRNGGLTLPLTNGRFSAMLGEPPLASLPPEVFTGAPGKDLFLRMWFNDTGDWPTQRFSDRKIVATARPFLPVRDVVKAGRYTPSPEQIGKGLGGFPFWVEFPTPFSSPPEVTAQLSGTVFGTEIEIAEVTKDGFFGYVSGFAFNKEIPFRGTVQPDGNLRIGDRRFGRYIASASDGQVHLAAWLKRRTGSGNLNTTEFDLHPLSRRPETGNLNFSGSLDIENSIFKYHDIEIVNGQPCLLMREEEREENRVHLFMYIASRGTTTSPLSTITMLADTTDNPLQSTYKNTSLADINGFAAIASTKANELLYRISDQKMKLFSPTALDQPFFTPPVVVANTVLSSAAMDLAEINGKPAIALLDFVDFEDFTFQLSVYVAEDRLGTTWNPPLHSTPLAFPSGDVEPKFITLKQGPAIIVRNTIIRAKNILGEEWEAPETLLPPTLTSSPPGGHIATLCADNFVHIAWGSGGRAYYSVSLDAEARTWLPPIDLGPMSDETVHIAIAFIENKLTVYWHDENEGGGSLRRAQARPSPVTINWFAEPQEVEILNE